MTNEAGSHWEPQPAGAAWIAAQLQEFRLQHPDVIPFELLLKERTGTRIVDWIDHLHVTSIAGIEAAGFVQAADGWYEHPGALLPVVKLAARPRMMLRVDSVIDFAAANLFRFQIEVHGSPGDIRREALFRNEIATVDFGVIERNGCSIRCDVPPVTDRTNVEIQSVGEMLRLRQRKFATISDAFESTERLIQNAVDRVGRNVACHLYFEAERNYWQARNRAGQIQYMRQASIGVGWGNHDHHTYRSSRICFSRLIGLLEQLGFECRERFYAGREAGWGAQVIEQPTCGIVIFADVDLSADEIAGDFSHHPLSSRSSLGTIGLWCALHGEALFEAGLHHLECQFDFNGARQQLEAFGVHCMKPFTDFPFLRQCFTEGERWNVDPDRITAAERMGWITSDQASRFTREGAIGSHLEILERNDGYRGFNQTGINEIIRNTDPRFNPERSGASPMALTLRLK
ncbi:MAG TPA: hypothetical protein PLR25_11400 [Planctomycetaceae bacterium]|nr:hypothetical protein [Planctomycetaceae bacterium]